MAPPEACSFQQLSPQLKCIFLSSLQDDLVEVTPRGVSGSPVESIVREVSSGDELYKQFDGRQVKATSAANQLGLPVGICWALALAAAFKVRPTVERGSTFRSVASAAVFSYPQCLLPGACRSLTLQEAYPAPLSSHVAVLCLV